MTSAKNDTRGATDADSRTTRGDSGPFEFVWTVVTRDEDQKDALVVLHKQTMEGLLELFEAVGCSTWGDLRTTLTTSAYAEICEMCGYESDLGSIDPDDVPSDDTPFDATTAILGYDEGWWPPAVWGLMHDELPLNIRNQYAEITVTTLDGTFATIPAERKDEVLAALKEQGHRLEEDAGLGELVNPWFLW